MTSTASEYVQAIVRRAREPMEPARFDPDWADQPRRYKVYDGYPEIAMPPGTGSPAPGGPGLRLESLAALLRQTFGLLERRLRVNGNSRANDPPWYQNATWSRGTASGGGLYPLEVYWVCGPSGPLLPGVYYYASVHHTLRRLLAGDVTGQVRDALPGRSDATDQYLLVTVKFWKNSFKYNSFCYHVVTMDLGALLGTWQLWRSATGLPGTPSLWFDEPALNRLLNLDTLAESTVAVLPLPPGPHAATTPDPGAVAPRRAAAVPAVERERSRTVLRFPLIEKVHQATVAAAPSPPPVGTLDRARPAPRRSGAVVPFPDGAGDTAPAALPAWLVAALHRRRSSFGRFTGHPPVALAALRDLLAAADAAGRLDCDARPAGEPALTRLAVFANHVDGLPAGAYDHHPQGLCPIPGPPVGPFLQRHYFLDNYNLEQAAAVIAVIARPAAVIDALGDRGYRLVNAEVGAVAQTLYLAAAAAGTGCGAVLGFDNVAVAERLGLAGTDEWPLLLVMVGPERHGAADIDFRLS